MWRAFPEAFGGEDKKDEVKKEKWIKFFFDQQGLFDRKRSQFLEKRQELQHLHQQTKSENEKLKYLKPQLRTLFLTSVITFLLGVIMMVFGFWNWHYKFQIYQDQIVKAQAEEWTSPKPETADREEIPG